MEGSLSIAVALALAAVWLSAGELSASATATAPAPAVSSKADAEFIRRSCKATRYPQLCERSLAGYAGSVHRSPRQLARLALSLSLDKAGSASSFVARLRKPRKGGSESLRQRRDAGAVRDCAETMQDSVERLRRSAREMGRMGRATSGRFGWHLSNVQTWVSGALTDQTTCLDSLAQNAPPSPRSSAIRSRVLAASQLTSNALALINRLAPT
ncbi:21 kDa protein-like [Ananas comosus]|uniref:21 kDa protein n=1 Tax=Ananas comosus TaxID=4615 RepID=A0A199VCQ1_ANACO|nr:21 kDa protein-like [Ananas comosus]OAY74646.1 21 kDa protein [Ananas comosus]